MSEVIQDAAASEDIALESGQEGKPGEESEGLVTPSEEEEPESGQEEGEAEEAEEGQEAETGTEETGKKGDKKTLDERVAELTAKALAKDREERAELERQASERMEAEKKPFVDLSTEQTAKLNEDYTYAFTRQLELAEEIRLTDDPNAKAQLIVEHRNITEWIRKTEAWYNDNEAKKAEWTEKQKQTEVSQQEAVERSTRLESTANVFRESKGIPQDVWDQGSKQFAEEIKNDKVLGLEFADAYRLKGDVGAVKFAYEWMEKKGEAAKAATAARDTAKNAGLGGKTETGTSINTVRSWDDYNKLSGIAQAKWAEKNPKAFDRILDEKRKKAS